MKNTAILCNVSRGATVNQEDLFNALKVIIKKHIELYKKYSLYYIVYPLSDYYKNFLG